MVRIVPLVLAVLTAACSPASDTPAEPEQVTPPANASSSGSSGVARSLGDSRYTHLSDCALLRSVPEKAGFTEHECPGEGGYRLRLTESDLREDIVVLAPGRGEFNLGLSRLARGAFSSVGDTIEWRTEVVRDPFTPRAIILRHLVMEDPDPGVPESAYLVVARLAPSPCVVARIAPGPAQNQLARKAADSDSACL